MRQVLCISTINPRCLDFDCTILQSMFYKWDIVEWHWWRFFNSRCKPWRHGKVSLFGYWYPVSSSHGISSFQWVGYLLTILILLCFYNLRFPMITSCDPSRPSDAYMNVSKLAHRCFRKRLSPVRRQAFIWINDGLLSIESSAINHISYRPKIHDSIECALSDNCVVLQRGHRRLASRIIPMVTSWCSRRAVHAVCCATPMTSSRSPPWVYTWSPMTTRDNFKLWVWTRSLGKLQMSLLAWIIVKILLGLILKSDNNLQSWAMTCCKPSGDVTETSTHYSGLAGSSSRPTVICVPSGHRT